MKIVQLDLFRKYTRISYPNDLEYNYMVYGYDKLWGRRYWYVMNVKNYYKSWKDKNLTLWTSMNK